MQRVKAVRWVLATNIVLGMVLTIPASALVAWIAFELIQLVVPGT